MNARPHFNAPGLPPTLMADRFLAALVKKIKTANSTDEIIVPTGTAVIGEIECVLRNLHLIRHTRTETQKGDT